MSSHLMEILCREQDVCLDFLDEDEDKASSSSSSLTGSASRYSPSASKPRSPQEPTKRAQDTSVSVEANESPLPQNLKTTKRLSRNALINGLRTVCDYFIFGCEELLSPEEREDHIESCPFDPEATLKCKECDASVKIASVEEHSCVRYLKGIIEEKEMQIHVQVLEVVQKHQQKEIQFLGLIQKLVEKIEALDDKVEDMWGLLSIQSDLIRELRSEKVKATVVPEEERSAPEVKEGRAEEEAKKAESTPSYGPVLVSFNPLSFRGRGLLKRSLLRR